jgi:hypothetical protein
LNDGNGRGYHYGCCCRRCASRDRALRGKGTAVLDFSDDDWTVTAVETLVSTGAILVWPWPGDAGVGP